VSASGGSFAEGASATKAEGTRAVVVRAAVSCAPCYQRSCDRAVCLEEVPVEEVVSEARALLSGELLVREAELSDELAAPAAEVGQGPEPVQGPMEVL
jgi:hypothetical protein